MVELARVMQNKVKGMRVKSKIHPRIITENMLLSTGIWKSFKTVLTISGHKTTLWTLLMFSISCALAVFWDIWVGWWSSNYLKLDRLNFYFEFLICISGFTGVYVLIRDNILALIVRDIAANIYFANLKKIMKTKNKWYDLFGVPMILFSMVYYQNSIDDDYGKLVSSSMTNILMILVSFAICNVFYPGIYFVVTLAVAWYAKTIIRKYIKANRIFMVEYLQSQINWFGSYVTAINHTAAMR